MKNGSPNGPQGNGVATSDTQALDTEGHKERGGWSNQCDFFLSCLGYAVGLGNVWRFPYLCYKNGGGAFLIPYSISLLVAGLPLFFLELSLGQYASLGPNILYKKLSPLFSGVGYAMLVITFLTALYYNMIIAWTVFYLCASFTSDLPWRTCQGEWAGEECWSPDENSICQENSNGSEAFYHGSCTSKRRICEENENLCFDKSDNCEKTLMGYVNQSFCSNTSALANEELKYEYIKIQSAVHYRLPSEEYFNNYVLQSSDSMEEYGGVKWQLALCLLAAWLMVGGSLIKGVKSSGKVVYFTALFPYVVLIILLFKGAFLEGAYDGIVFYITPNWETLSSPVVWGNAATQIFYSLGPAFGGLLTLASYNRFNNNCQRDAVLVAFSNCGTSVFAGFVIFSIVGHMAHLLDVPVGDVIASGPGLAFIAYPQALAQMPIAPLWAIFFFIMLITLGLDSQFVMVETLTTAIFDEFPSLRQYKSKVVIGACVIGYIVGLLFCTPGGIYLFNLIDNYAAGFSLLIIAIIEIIVVVYIYGYNNFFDNIKEMMGAQWLPSRVYWQWTWKLIAPVLLLGILGFTFAVYVPPTYGKYEYPVWAQVLGWFMTFLSVGMVPLFAILKYLDGKKKGLTIHDLLLPTPDWGPAATRDERKKNAELVQQQKAATRKEHSYDNPAFANSGNKVQPISYISKDYNSAY